MTWNDFRLAAVAGVGAVLLLAGAQVPAQAQTQKIVTCPPQQLDLIKIPQIDRRTDGKLKATLKLVDGVRTLWGDTGDNRCATQRMRFFEGYEGFDPAHHSGWPAGQEPIPGPTFRARLGDLVEITFFNQIDPNNFASTLDRGAVGRTEACDQYTSSTSSNSSINQYGKKTGAQTNGDVFPDCLHGSSTTNVHYHGTHTTPSTTGDNVLLFVRPSLRTNDPKQPILPSEPKVHAVLADFYTQCEAKGAPKSWSEMPVAWQNLQKSLLQQYDTTAPYKGHAGTPGHPALPHHSQLWPVNEGEIKAGMWPQYQLGADPYCFPLPYYGGVPKYGVGPVRMGQSPGTQWYHAHKHGSTALNVANGMTGVLIIAGDYDDKLHKYYGKNFQEQVLVIQQLSTAPFPLTNPATGGPGSPRPRISVNGRLDPVVKMQPGEVQMWRVVNGAFRDGVQFAYFKPQPPSPAGITPPPPPQCDPPGTPTPPPTVQWKQIAQDGVQFDVANYDRFGSTVNNPFNLAPANRADLLVQAPAQTGKYTLCVVTNNGLLVQAKTPGSKRKKAVGAPDDPAVMLTVSVGGGAVNPPMSFIPDASFPKQPAFLKDITRSEIHKWREMVFGGGNQFIDGKTFSDHHIDQIMTLNTAEEWVVKNQATDKSHPFHIHINPFQIIELFEPNSDDSLRKPTPDKPNPCYVDPLNPDTFDPGRVTFKQTCPSRLLPGPWIWWDTFPIPTAHTYQLDASVCTTKDACPQNIQSYVTCVAANPTGTPPTPASCSVNVPGYFRMRSRFVDFTGFYVLHCHILVHEDRGMMQLIEVVSDETPYSHH